MLPRLLRSQAPLLRRPIISRPWNRTLQQKRTLIAPPKAGDGPLMSRRSDRALPEVEVSGMRWKRTIPIFLAILTSATLAIFNYQKSSSPVVASTMYSLRTSPKAREYLGSNIYYASKMPWIWGEMNQLHGRIDISFRVKGDRASGLMRFKSFRHGRMGVFETTEWSLETEDGGKIDLLEEGGFVMLEAEEGGAKSQPGRGSYAPNLSG